MLDEHYTQVKKVLGEYRDAIEKMTAVLLDVEVIEGSRVRQIIQEYEEENGMQSRLAHGDKVAKEEEQAERANQADF